MAQYAQKDYDRAARVFDGRTFDECVAANWWKVVRLIRGALVEIQCRGCGTVSQEVEVGLKCPRCSRETGKS